MTKINSKSSLNIVVLSVGLLNHVMIIPLVLEVAGRDAWLFAALTGLLSIAWGFLLYWILKKKKTEHLFPWLENRIGKRFTKLIFFFLVIYLITIILTTAKDMVDWINTTSLNQTPPFAIIIPFALICAALSYSNLRSIAINSAILLPFVIILGIFVATGNIPEKNYDFLFPLFEQGYFHGIKSMYYIANGYLELIIMILFQHHLSNGDSIKLKTVIGMMVIVTILILGPLTGAIVEFGPVLSNEMRYPAYEQWRLLTIGKYIAHTDFFSIYQWLSGAFIRISIAMFLIPDLLRVKSPLIKKGILMSLAIMMVIITIIPLSNIIFYAFLKNYYFQGTFFFLVTLILLFTVTAVIQPKRREVSDETIQK
ncbi:endospore germination permease [Peribacillus butanolivorans]|uniref:GerAB/ArcD/ProY family transporter n=1 Tax=Peribacillus butanolivorans TaxID=421767 RepID=UPI003D2D8925